jgi:hypothetical protein
MVNPTGTNGIFNGICECTPMFAFMYLVLPFVSAGPPDDVLSAALHDYSRRSLPLAQRLDYLLKDFGYKIRCVFSYCDEYSGSWGGHISRSTLKTLNRTFKVPTVKKPPPDYIATTLIAEVVTNNVSSQNGPQTIQTQISLQDGAKILRSVQAVF